MEKETVTLPRAITAGTWGAILFFVGRKVMADEFAGFLVGMPFLGLPWLIFLLNDRSESDVKTSGGEAALTILGGAIISTFCTLPVVLVFGFLARLFH
jgi:hypothetical protein